jgi:hypothetical protein
MLHKSHRGICIDSGLQSTLRSGVRPALICQQYKLVCTAKQKLARFVVASYIATLLVLMLFTSSQSHHNEGTCTDNCMDVHVTVSDHPNLIVHWNLPAFLLCLLFPRCAIGVFCSLDVPSVSSVPSMCHRCLLFPRCAIGVFCSLDVPSVSSDASQSNVNLHVHQHALLMTRHSTCCTCILSVHDMHHVP